MPNWRCPHCGTPQAEASRCWVCRRSSTSCATCRHFRQPIAAWTGYCGLDRSRGALVGDEVRACWEGRAAVLPAVGPERPFSELDLPASVEPAGHLWADAD